MLRFLTTISLLVILFFSGVLLGMNQASLSMIEMRGFSNQSFHEAIQTKESAQPSEYEVEVLGEPYEQVSVEERQETYEEMQTSHGILKLAFGLERFVQWLYNSFIYLVYQLVQVFYA